MQTAVQATVGIKLAKAREFLDMAEFASDEHMDAAVSLAVTAAISASDALCLLAYGNYPTGPNHAEAANVLRRAGFRHASAQLLRVLAVKNKAQYSALRCSAREAKESITQSARILERATQEAKKAGFSDD